MEGLPHQVWQSTKVMRLTKDESIRRFLKHVLTDGFPRIGHYGLLASAQRQANIPKVRALIGASPPEQQTSSEDDPAPLTLQEPCPCCVGTTLIIETFKRDQVPRSRTPPKKQAA